MPYIANKATGSYRIQNPGDTPGAGEVLFPAEPTTAQLKAAGVTVLGPRPKAQILADVQALPTGTFDTLAASALSGVAATSNQLWHLLARLISDNILPPLTLALRQELVAYVIMTNPAWATGQGIPISGVGPQ